MRRQRLELFQPLSHPRTGRAFRHVSLHQCAAVSATAGNEPLEPKWSFSDAHGSQPRGSRKVVSLARSTQASWKWWRPLIAAQPAARARPPSFCPSSPLTYSFQCAHQSL
jgi:hypothetical protein